MIKSFVRLADTDEVASESPASVEFTLASFIESPDRATCWLSLQRGSNLVHALVPPGSAIQSDDGSRQTHWSRCTWEGQVDPQTAEPDDCQSLTVVEALACARQWSHIRGPILTSVPGAERWVVEASIAYAHLLLTHVGERVAYEGHLSPEVCRKLANPAFDLISQLRSIAKNTERPEYHRMLRDGLADLHDALAVVPTNNSSNGSDPSHDETSPELDFTPVYAAVSCEAS